MGSLNCGLKAFRGDVARSLQLSTDMHRFIPVLVALNMVDMAEARGIRLKPEELSRRMGVKFI
ncbi:MAG: hypothetical protein EBR62_09500, partial [Verrucomicrobia bacterium]|nr:hypothetical protein [Verrucomicrobiota bacterium]